MKAPLGVALGLVMAAAAAAVVPVPRAAIERIYSTGVYPVLQHSITGLSNRAPFALLDVLLLSAIVAWLAATAIDVHRIFRLGPARVASRLALRTVVPAAVLYLGFLVLWGFNYRRIPLQDKLVFDQGAVTPQAARALAFTAVSRVNALHERAYATGWPDDSEVDASLASAFSTVERALGAPGTTVPSRPKLTLLDWYFRPAAVAGMTDPFFLETLVVSDLLPFERPFIVAHEWSHLAGFADEGEANFVGWLTCVHGTASAQYSGWLFLYGELAGALPRRDRAEVAARLAPGPREDLRQVAARLTHDVSPRVSAAGWRVYDRYLKANRIEAGAASYAQVVTLALGTRLDASWTPTVIER